MTRFLLRFVYPLALAAGLAAIAWAGLTATRQQPFALLLTALIAAAYLLGVADLRAFRQASQQLALALTRLGEPLDSWLAALPAALRDGVRQRLDGTRSAPAAPPLAPALAGLLVLLGMLGSFIGLVHTLGGTAAALRASSDLEAMRAALTTPVQGLGLAFGSSVAGVAASAMLGLLTTLARRERAAVAEQLDAALAGPLRTHSSAGRREALQQALPALVSQLQGVGEQLVHQQAQFQAQLLAAQQRFQAEAEQRYALLAERVQASLQQALRDGAEASAAALQHAGERTLAALAQQGTNLLERQGETVAALAQAGQLQLQKLGEQLDARSAAWLEQLSAAQLAQQAHQQAALAAAEGERLAAWQQRLDALAERLQQQAADAAAQAQAQQRQHAEQMTASVRQLAEHTADASRATIAEAGQLLRQAAEAPRAAAEVVAALREQLSQSLVQDQAVLAERAQLLQTVQGLLAGLQHAAGEQRAAVDALLERSAAVLDQQLQQFGERSAAAGEALAAAGSAIGSGAAQMAALGEGFATAVQRFDAGAERLLAQLARLDGGLERAQQRADDQLGYYVGQARELIDLCLMSQQRLLQELRAKPLEVANG